MVLPTNKSRNWLKTIVQKISKRRRSKNHTYSSSLPSPKKLRRPLRRSRANQQCLSQVLKKSSNANRRMATGTARKPRSLLAASRAIQLRMQRSGEPLAQSLSKVAQTPRPSTWPYSPSTSYRSALMTTRTSGSSSLARQRLSYSLLVFKNQTIWSNSSPFDLISEWMKERYDIWLNKQTIYFEWILTIRTMTDVISK